MFYSPLEQFEINLLVPLKFGNFDISITNSTLFALLAFTLLSLLLSGTFFNSKLIPTKWQSIAEMLYEFVLGLVIDNIGPKGHKFFPLLFTIFSFVLIANLVGMVPYSFTITSHIAITFGLGLSMFIGIIILGLKTFKLHFFSLFFPQGAPVIMAPLIVPIEFVSYFTRPISLSIRLTANMLSGHALLKIIANFAWLMGSAGGALAIASSIPLILLFVLMGLEIGIACLQAYVFTVLLSIYINESLHLH